MCCCPGSLEWPANDADGIRAKWDSIKDAELGAEFIFSLARSFDWHGGVHEFKAIEQSGEDDSEEQPESWIDRYAYVSGIDRYYDLKTGALLTESAFKRVNSAFGHPADARNNAAMLFQVHRQARKVDGTDLLAGASRYTDEGGLLGRKHLGAWADHTEERCHRRRCRTLVEPRPLLDTGRR